MNIEAFNTDTLRNFRAMETVAHDNWEPGRHPNPKQAKLYYEEIKLRNGLGVLWQNLLNIRVRMS